MEMPVLPLFSMSCCHAEIAYIVTTAAGTCVDIPIQSQGSMHCMQMTTLTVQGVRLVGGDVPSEGILQISVNNTYGTVCRDSFDKAAAEVVCRQLGFPGPGFLYQPPDSAAAAAEAELLPIWMDGLACSGAEEALQECPFEGWGEHDCSHASDVALICLETSTENTGKEGLCLPHGSAQPC